jgi:RNA polymerase sigma factor (sigma-70 family)
MKEVSADFLDQLRGIRAGEPRAVELFVATYEPFIRRTIRHRLGRAALRSVADSIDVCQSVFGSFLIRLSAGEYELKSERDLQRLLVVITQNKFMALQRREMAEKRDRRITVSLDSIDDIEDYRQTNDEQSARQVELVSAFERSLSIEERQLFMMRRQGLEWSVIAEELNENAVVLRKRLSRAVQRVARELGLESEGEKNSDV